MRYNDQTIQSKVENIINGPTRKSLYHVTDLRNIASISRSNSLVSCNEADLNFSAERRQNEVSTSYHGLPYVASRQLSIAETAFEAGVTPGEFRSFLNQHVFFWPTKRDCLNMVMSFQMRSPDKRILILKLNAYSVLCSNLDRVKISKYDSGSSPRYPRHCSYKKSVQMFVSAHHFGAALDGPVPKKASEIKEILIENKVPEIEEHLETIYSSDLNDVPKKWRYLWESIGKI